jgi:hypothetical protein
METANVLLSEPLRSPARRRMTTPEEYARASAIGPKRSVHKRPSNGDWPSALMSIGVIALELNELQNSSRRRRSTLSVV